MNGGLFLASSYDNLFFKQKEISSGNQLVHSEYLQLLTGLVIGLGLDSHFVSPPSSCHLPPKATPSEWAWLQEYSNTIRLSDCFKKRQVIPPHLQTIPGNIEIISTEKYQPNVREKK